LRDEYTRTIEPARALAAETLKLERVLNAECGMRKAKTRGVKKEGREEQEDGEGTGIFLSSSPRNCATSRALPLAARPLPPAHALGDGAKPRETRQTLPVDALR
jgi:hypothetical protein